MPGGGGGSKQTTTSSNEPWKGSQGALKYGISEAQSKYKSGEGAGVYGGQRVADQSAQTQGGLNALTNTANQNMGGAGLSGQYQGIIDNGGYNAAQQNALQNTQNLANSSWSISPELQKVLDYQNQKAIDATNGVTSAAGRYGSASQANAMANAIGNVNNNLLYNDLTNYQARQDAANNNLFSMGGQGIGNLGTAYSGMNAPTQDLLNAGQLRDAYSQNLINADIAKFDEGQNAGWNNLSRLNAIASGAGSLGGSSTQTTSSGSGQNGLLNILGYGLTAGGMLGGFL